MSTLNLALIGGDGTGPEVTVQAVRALNAVAPKFGITVKTTDFDYGGRSIARQGVPITDEQVEELRKFDAIYLGAVGLPSIAPGVLEKGLLLKLRFALDLYINLRPVNLYPGVETPLKDKTAKEIDFVVVRENTEDLYSGAGGIHRKGTEFEVATQEMIATSHGCERAIRYAFDLAGRRERKHLTLVHKTNVLTFCGDLWKRTFDRVAKDYPTVQVGYHHVDACCMYMATRPELYDVIVVPNMFGDIITDLGAAIAGGMGIAASGNLNPNKGFTGMFEPIHGSSPDIAGQNKANPLAACDAMGMLLCETGRKNGDANMVKAGEAITAAVKRVTPKFTGKKLDRSGYTTSEIGDWVVAEIGK